MGTLNRSVGLRHTAVALAMGLLAQTGTAKERAAQAALADSINASLRWHHRGILSHKPSGAAAAKRASRKRRNVLKMKRRNRSSAS